MVDEEIVDTLLLNDKNDLHNRSMQISGLFDISSKQDIESIKQDIEDDWFPKTEHWSSR